MREEAEQTVVRAFGEVVVRSAGANGCVIDLSGNYWTSERRHPEPVEGASASTLSLREHPEPVEGRSLRRKSRIFITQTKTI
jgi:hypothetical protein